MENEKIEPKIGLGATLIYYSDRIAMTIIEISPSGKTLKLQRDTAIRIDNNGMSDSQQYKYKRDRSGEIIVAKLRKDGKYRTSSGGLVIVGTRREYYDYCF